MSIDSSCSVDVIIRLKGAQVKNGIAISVVFAILRGSMTCYPGCLTIVRFYFYYLTSLQTEVLLSEVFLATKGSFFASRTLTWYDYCSRNWPGCGRPEARGYVKARELP